MNDERRPSERLGARLDELPATGPGRLLGAADIRELATALDLQPTKKLGQNFVIDGNTVRKIVAAAELAPDSHVLEIGPGLGSLTLGLLDAGHRVTAVEVDPRLAELLPQTVHRFQPEARLRVIQQDALQLAEIIENPPTALVANLPYNISVPVLLRALERQPALHRVLVMVQAEVGHRLAAQPGSKVYGVPSIKASWYGRVRGAGTVSRQVFWPVPNVDSILVRLDAAPPPGSAEQARGMFALVDAAFQQRRKMLRQSLAGVLGDSIRASEVLGRAGIAETARAEELTVQQFFRIQQAAAELPEVPLAGASIAGGAASDTTSPPE